METADLTQVKNFNYSGQKIFEKAQDFYQSMERTM